MGTSDSMPTSLRRISTSKAAEGYENFALREYTQVWGRANEASTNDCYVVNQVMDGTDQNWPVSDREGQSRSPTSVTLDFRLFRDLQCVVDVDAEVPDSAFPLAVPEQQLHHPQVLSPAVNQRRLCPVSGWGRHPALRWPRRASCGSRRRFGR